MLRDADKGMLVSYKWRVFQFLDISNEQLNAAADTVAAVAIAKETGFVISADELQRAQAEVSEEELEWVVGGAVPNEQTNPANAQSGCGGPSTCAC